MKKKKKVKFERTFHFVRNDTFVLPVSLVLTAVSVPFYQQTLMFVLMGLIEKVPKEKTKTTTTKKNR